MRVIAGSLKGRRLEAPDWPGLRPTSDRLRETLFNILAPRIEGARVLDGYAGTGAVGIEALSRGAAHVTFVEQDRRAQRLIEANLRACGVSDRYAIIRAGFAAACPELVEWAAQSGGEFDLICLDPPYGTGELSAALEAGSSLVGPESLLILEHATRDPAPEITGSIQRTRQVVHGDSTLTFYRRRTND